jgi:predicted transcriptional regulator of viral defense system
MNYYTYSILSLEGVVFCRHLNYTKSVIIHILKELKGFQYTMNTPTGIGKLDRARITTLLRGTQYTVSVNEAAKILQLPNAQAAKLLARWSNKGWFARIKRGLYVAIPLESATSDISLEDPFIIAEKIYDPCYIGGWSAAEYWGLTEQIFRTVVVFTVQKQYNQHPDIKGTKFLLSKIPESFLFGLKPIWRGQIKVLISDPSRVIIDILNIPKLGGGIRSVADIFTGYLKSEYKNLMLLAEYAKKLNNGAIYKRLGFLLEQFAPEEKELITLCNKGLSFGNAKLDPQLECNHLITRWRLWVPENWKK